MENISLVALLCLALLVSACRGTSPSGDEDIKTILQELRDNDARQEEKISQQNSEIEMLKKEILANQESITGMELKIKELQEEKFDATEKQTMPMKSENASARLATRGQRVRDPPEVYYCGYQAGRSSHGPITYDSLFYDRNNQGTGGLSISSGTFTAPYPGTYQVTWSLYAGLFPGQGVLVYLYRGSQRVEESFHSSRYPGSSGNVSGPVWDQGGRTLFLHLDLGEQLHLEFTEGAGRLFRVFLCASLAQFDKIE